MIYVHIPFCKSKCIYCDFFSCPVAPGASFVDEVCAEAFARREEIAAAAAVNTLYIGGGTPSVLPICDLGRIADSCGGRYYREWTVEVNPDDVSAGYARGLREQGVNRVSMGVQSLDDGMLRWMNRRHHAAGARSAFASLRAAGFDNISVDIIYGINGMDLKMLRATVEEIVSWRPEHISAYSLSVDNNSALGRMCHDGEYCEIDGDDHYAYVCSALAAAGYEHYEISNWALPGHRAVHNSAYWTRASYVGLGPSAHSLAFDNTAITDSVLSRLPKLHTLDGVINLSSPSGTSPVISTGAQRSGEIPCPTVIPGHPVMPGLTGHLSAGGLRFWNSDDLHDWKLDGGEVLTEREVWEEEVMLGLRTSEGIPQKLLTNVPPEDEDNYTPGESLPDPRKYIDRLVPSAVPGNLRIPEDLWFTADDTISGILELS